MPKRPFVPLVRHETQKRANGRFGIYPENRSEEGVGE